MREDRMPTLATGRGFHYKNSGILIDTTFAIIILFSDVKPYLRISLLHASHLLGPVPLSLLRDHLLKLVTQFAHTDHDPFQPVVLTKFVCFDTTAVVVQLTAVTNKLAVYICMHDACIYWMLMMSVYITGRRS